MDRCEYREEHINNYLCVDWEEIKQTEEIGQLLELWLRASTQSSQQAELTLEYPLQIL